MTILEIFAKQAVELAAKAIESKFLKNEAKLSESDITPRNLQLHLKYVANWSAGIQLYGLGKAKDTDSETIELLYHETARKFRAKNSGNDKKTEQSILYDAAHIILVGDPGAGKTTTLKRVARSIFKESIEGHAQTYQLPILIRLKELERYSDIYQYLGELMGFPDGIKEKVIVEEIKKQDYDDDGKKIVRVERKETKIPYPAIGGTEVTQFIINFLDNSGALLLIDGLDEIKKNLFSAFVSDIRKLALELSFAKIIITSRTGVYYTLGTIEGFTPQSLQFCVKI